MTASRTRAMARKILAFIRRYDRFLVTAHARADGDALGSQLAFQRLLRKLGKRSHVVCDGGVLPEYRFLPGSGRVGTGPKDLRGNYGAIVALDCGAWDRLERLAPALPLGDLPVLNVDHHASNDRFGDLNWVDPSFSSTGEMIWEVLRVSRVRPDRAIATCIYTALLTDTGRFSFSNTTAQTHLRTSELLECGVRPAEVHREIFRQKTPGQLRFAAACLQRIRISKDGRVGWLVLSRDLYRKTGYEPAETQEYIDNVKSLKGVKVAVLLRETNVSGKIKISWRTDPGIDGIALARRWGGGGHARASGATFWGTLAKAEREVVRETLRFSKRARR